MHDDGPPIALEEIEAHFPPTPTPCSFRLAAPIAMISMPSRYLAAKRKGYHFATYVSSRAIVWPDLHVGENSMIFEAAVIGPVRVNWQ